MSTQTKVRKIYHPAGVLIMIFGFFYKDAVPTGLNPTVYLY